MNLLLRRGARIVLRYCSVVAFGVKCHSMSCAASLISCMRGMSLRHEPVARSQVPDDKGHCAKIAFGTWLFLDILPMIEDPMSEDSSRVPQYWI